MPAATSPCAAFIAEMEQEAVATRRMLERVPAEKLGWRPHPKSHTLGQLAMHLASTPAIVTGLMGPDVVEEGSVDFRAAQPATVGEIRKKFEEALTGAKAALSQWGERELATVWRFQKAGKDLMALPKGAMLRSIVLNHHVHHRGQLTVYLRMLEVPLPSVYGPSADENPLQPPAESPRKAARARA
jgi:uncharacterized damage-inducible protein DinB